LCLASCAGSVNLRTLNNQAQTVVKEGQGLIKEGRVEEGIKMLQAAKQLHKEDPTIDAAIRKIPADQAKFLRVDPMLGFNKAHMRAKIVSTTAQRIAWYIPDRIKDLIDMFTADVSFGPQLGAGVWATRAVQGVAYVGATGGYGYHQKTLLGFRGESDVELGIGPVGGSVVAGARAGLGGAATTLNALALHTPSHPLYQDYRDYWAVGGKVGFFIIGAEVEYHPLEIWDALAGFILMDPLEDDLATSRRLRFTKDQRMIMKTFNQMVRRAGKEDRAKYAKQYPTVFPAK
jgi:hypothetical protein